MLNFGNKEFRNLQEQVLENAKNIEILKKRPTFKPVVVAELPAVGEENILYLVPKNPDPDTSDADSYDEYIWLPEKQTYEFVGSTVIKISNMVTTDTEQTITGAKSFSTAPLPSSDSSIDLGSSSYKWKDLHLSGTQYFYSSTDNGEDWNIKNTNGTLYYERANLSYSLAIGGTAVSSVNLVPKSNNSYSLGSDSAQWKDLYLAGQINFSKGPSIKQDSSNRIVITEANGADRIKIGGESSTYCAANWTPDQNATYDLGTSALNWKDLYLSGKIQSTGSLGIFSYVGTNTTGFTLGNGIIQANRNLAATTNETRDLGSSSIRWLTTYTKNISDGTNNIAVADIATKPNYANPNVFASGTLDANGEGIIDISAQGVGMPEDGLYMFTYGNAQCFIALTSSMIQNATLYPMRCPCPVLKESGGVITGNTGNLKISRASDILTIKVASTVSGSATSTNGWGWQLIKVM